MGYTTEFDGCVKTDKPVVEEIFSLINGLSKTRRMKRKMTGFGVEGEFYYDPESTNYGQDYDSKDVIDSNTPPSTQPGLWLQWKMKEDKQTIEWDGGEKFYAYIEWMEYIIKQILAPAGYIVNGEIAWSGEEVRDNGVIVVENNYVYAE